MSDVLVARKEDLAQASGMSADSRVLGETVSSGPYFKIVLSNLLPYWIMQPWVEPRSRSGYRPGGLLAQCGVAGVQVPRSQRHPVPQRCAAARAAGARGHPGSPGTGRGAGSPCSYAPPPELLPRPGNPMPCALSINTRARSGRMGPTRRYPTSPPRRRTPTDCPRHRGSRSPGDPGRCNPTCPAPRCQSHPDRPGRAPSRWDRYRARLRRIPRQHPRQQHCHPDPRPRRDPAGSCRHRSSATQVEPEAAA